MKRVITKTIIAEYYAAPPRKNYSTNKVLYNHIDEIWSIALADFSNHETLNNKGFRYIFNKNDDFSNYLWAIPFKN